MKNDQMLTGSLFKNIFLFSIPLIFSNVLQVLFNMSDLAVIGRFSGSDSLGMIGSTVTLVTLFIGFLIGLSNGINVVVAHHLGEKADLEVMKTVHTSFVLAIIMGGILMVIGLIFGKPLLMLLGTKEEFLSGASLYLLIYFLGLPGLAIYNFGNSVLSANGNTSKPFVILFICGILNVLLNLLFVIVFHMDVAGVAFATIFSEYLSGFLIVFVLMKDKTKIGLHLKQIRIYKGYCKDILMIGLPSGFQSAIFAIANLFIQVGVNQLESVDVKGNSAAMNADALVYDVMAAFYLACSSFMSQAYGAKQKKRVLQSYLVSMTYSFLFGMAFGMSLVLFGNSFLRLFTSDLDVIASGMERLKIMGFSYGFSAFMDCTIAASRGLGKTFISTIIVIIGSCIFRIVWIKTVFAHYHTIPSLYLLYIFSWIITGVAEILYFIHIYKIKMKELDAHSKLGLIKEEIIVAISSK